MSETCQRCDKKPASESRGYDEEWSIKLCPDCAAWYDRQDEADQRQWIDDMELEIKTREQGVQR